MVSREGTYWTRTCQECGYKQISIAPKQPITDAYLSRECCKCKSPALDYGGWKEWPLVNATVTGAA